MRASGTERDRSAGRRAWIAGATATFVAQSVAYWLPALGLPRLDMPLLNGNVIAPESTALAFSWSVGALHTLGVGALLGYAHERWVRTWLPGGPVGEGVLWGLVVGLVSGLAVFPLLYGGGLFGSDWSPSMPATLACWYLAWGGTLGLGVQRRS